MSDILDWCWQTVWLSRGQVSFFFFSFFFERLTEDLNFSSPSEYNLLWKAARGLNVWIRPLLCPPLPLSAAHWQKGDASVYFTWQVWGLNWANVYKTSHTVPYLRQTLSKCQSLFSFLRFCSRLQWLRQKVSSSYDIAFLLACIDFNQEGLK